MKALTILQPWASLIACGAKKIETRSWPTKYRGPLAIHAGKFMFSPYACELPDGLAKLAMDVLFPGSNGYPLNIYDNWQELPQGKVIAIAELVDCVKMISDGTVITRKGKRPLLATKLEGGIEICEQELAFGDYAPGRYAWILENVRPIDPVPAKGMQRLWEWNGRKHE